MYSRSYDCWEDSFIFRYNVFRMMLGVFYIPIDDSSDIRELWSYKGGVFLQGEVKQVHSPHPPFLYSPFHLFQTHQHSQLPSCLRPFIVPIVIQGRVSWTFCSTKGNVVLHICNAVQCFQIADSSSAGTMGT